MSSNVGLPNTGLPLPLRHPTLSAFLRDPAAMTGLILLATVAGLAVLAPWVYPGDPLAMVTRPLLWPGEAWAHPLGSDSMGRDVLAGIAHGARVSLVVGLIAAVLSVAIGVLVGAVGGYFGGWLDDVLVRITELFQTVPSFLLVIVLVTIGRPSATVVVFAIGLASWPVIARLVRAEFRSLREREFVLAARARAMGMPESYSVKSCRTQRPGDCHHLGTGCHCHPDGVGIVVSRAQ